VVSGRKGGLPATEEGIGTGEARVALEWLYPGAWLTRARAGDGGYVRRVAACAPRTLPWKIMLAPRIIVWGDYI